MNTSALITLSANGLQLAPAQVWGTVRLVPVLQKTPIEGLRLHRQVVDSFLQVVTHGTPQKPKQSYVGYVPHAFVMRFGDDSEMAAVGARLTKGALVRKEFADLPMAHRMVKRTSQGLRMLPLHLAMEGYLTYQFGGPKIAFSEYCEQAFSSGLSPRIEWSIRGGSIPELRDALRVFEMHESQVGVLMFVGDRLTSAVVLPHPDDYRLLHKTMLDDFFADQLLHYARGYPEVPDWVVDTSKAQVTSVGDIASFLEKTRRDWSDFHGAMANAIWEGEFLAKQKYRLGQFTLHQLLPSFDLDSENHIGEVVLTASGRLAYLKTYRLSNAQTRRGYLLKQLADAGWDLVQCAAALKTSHAALLLRLDNAGFGYLIKPHVLEHARRTLR